MYRISFLVPEEPPGSGSGRPGFEGDLEAIRAGGAKIGGSILFKKLNAAGTVWLADAVVGANFDCSDALFDFPGETALWADGIQVTGTTYLSTYYNRDKIKEQALTNSWEGGRTNGMVRFGSAVLKRGLTVANFHFSGAGAYGGRRADDPQMFVTERDREKIYGKPESRNGAPVEHGCGACGIYAPSCQIQGRFLFHSVSIDGDNDRVLLLSLRNAKADVLDYHPHFCRADDDFGWDSRARLDFNHFEYREIAYLDAERAKDWLKRLDRRYAPGNSGLASCTTIFHAAARWRKRVSKTYAWKVSSQRIERVFAPSRAGGSGSHRLMPGTCCP